MIDSGSFEVLFPQDAPPPPAFVPYEDREEAVWGCSFCAGEFPERSTPDIVIVGESYHLRFCSVECTREAGYPTAASHHERMYAMTGMRVTFVVQPNERLINPTDAADRAAFPDVVRAFLEDIWLYPPIIAGDVPVEDVTADLSASDRAPKASDGSP